VSTLRLEKYQTPSLTTDREQHVPVTRRDAKLVHHFTER
jgi:hypothetical protein